MPISCDVLGGSLPLPKPAQGPAPGAEAITRFSSAAKAAELPAPGNSVQSGQESLI